MRNFRLLAAAAAILLFLALSAGPGQAMFHKKKDKPKAPAKPSKVQLCIKAGVKSCKVTVEKECKGKKGFKKDLCEKTTRKSCKAASEKACNKKFGKKKKKK